MKKEESETINYLSIHQKPLHDNNQILENLDPSNIQ